MTVAHDELARIEIEIQRVHLALARHHVVVGDGTPRVGPRDSLRVARLKERLLGLRRELSRALATADREGGELPSPQPRGALH